MRVRFRDGTLARGCKVRTLPELRAVLMRLTELVVLHVRLLASCVTNVNAMRMASECACYTFVAIRCPG